MSSLFLYLTTNMKQIQAVIFDMDGTLIDSEPIYTLSDCALVASYGGHMTPDEHHAFIGTGSLGFVRYIKQKYNLADTEESMLRRYKDSYFAMAKGRITVFPEMVRYLKELKSLGIKTAVASGSSKEVIEAMMNETELTGYLDLMVSSDEVEKGKPAPDVFLETARRLGVPPGACAAIEDSLTGMKAVKAANMVLVAVPGPQMDIGAVKMIQPDYFYNDMDSFRFTKALPGF
jgi:HAD superfamily hydrolase (TIGR01509 family)